MKVLAPTPQAPQNLTPEQQHEAHKRAQVAREFEGIFLRKMLSSLEKANKIGTSGEPSGAGDLYNTMMVGALADAVADKGGIGIADMILRSLPHASTTSTVEPKNPPQGPTAPAVPKGKPDA